MISLTSPIGIFGGTFDPIHFGHLRLAYEVWQELELDHVRFIPCKQPALKSMPQSSESQRLMILQLALKNHPQLIIDQRELQREGVSYMVDTLQSLRTEFSKNPLCLILGSDAFSHVDKWHQWEKLIELGHIVVVHRPNFDFQFSVPVEQFLHKHQTTIITDLQQQSHGKIFLKEITLLDISASRIRSDINKGLAPKFLLPDEVLEYLIDEKLYQN